MTTTIHGVYGGSVVIEDDDGQGEVPLSMLGHARDRAVASDRARAVVLGRSWRRDSLILADNTARELGLVELPSCVMCVDGPAVDVDHKGRRVCLRHMPREG